MITNGDSNYISRFGWTHKVINDVDEENELKQKRPQEEQVTSKRRKLDDDKRYLPMEEVSDLLDEAYDRAIKLNECQQTSTVAIDIIEGIKDAYVEVILTEEEEADRLRCLALLYRNKGNVGAAGRAHQKHRRSLHKALKRSRRVLAKRK